MSAAAARPSPLDSLVDRIRATYDHHRSLSTIVMMAIVAAVLPVLALVPPFSGFNAQIVWVDSFANAGVFVLLALGLNIVVGLAGLLDLGYAAFFAIGAYTYAFGASPFSGNDFPFWIMLLVGAFVAATFGILLGAPTLRLRGDYLAIVTLGFGEIVPTVFLNADRYTKGTNGIGGVYLPALGSYQFHFTDPWPYYITMVGIITVAIMAIFRLQDSRLGRAWMAVREDELAAASNGVNLVSTKLLAFALGASTAGLGGVFTAAKLSFVSPDQFGFTVSFTVLAMVVLGGMGNVWGVGAGAFLIFIIQTVILKQLNQFFAGIGSFGPIDLSKIDFLQYQYLLYGLALVGMMLLRPEGLFPSGRRRRELHEAEETPEDVESLPTGAVGGAGK